ncbi:methyl-accepting chemotaxis protein [Streptomyces sp. NPDC002018]|uniref:methyl-accepting chemotaxis protein n=1 Tax=Streptomyces sp. NPDC002018 TaxID=3364629 RepID=UPI00367882BF
MPVGALADRATVAKQLRDLADQEELAARRDELRSLADALQGLGDGDLEPWTELDLLQAYARPESLSAMSRDDSQRPLWGRLEAALGALVFVPLLLTWFGLTKATSAYEALTGADPRMAARPFLQLWQSGFEGRLTGWFTFGHVASAATAVIALLFLLTAAHGARRAREERQEVAAQRVADDLMARLVPLLTRTQLLLNEERLSSPGRFAAELSAAAVTLGRLGDKAVKAQKHLVTAASTVGEAVEGAERRLAGVDTAVRPLEDAATRIETAVRVNGGEVGKAVASLADPLRSTGEQMASAVSGSGVMVRQALEDVRAVSGEVRDTLGQAGERVEDSVHTLAAAQRSFTTATEVASDVSGRVLDRLTEVTEETAKAVATSQQAVSRLDAQTQALHEAAARFAELAAALPGAPGPTTPAVRDAAPATPAVHDVVPTTPAGHPADREPADAR